MSRPTEIRWRPLTTWTGGLRAGNRQLSKKWRGQLATLLHDLRSELGELGVLECIIETDHEPAGYSRLDGAPRSDAGVKSLRVALWFEVAGQQRVMRCDAHPTWVKNLQAIALTLQRNRLIREYGTATIEEQYGGFAALPPGSGGGNGSARREATPNELRDAAARLMLSAGRPAAANFIDQVIRDGNYRRQIFREAAKRAHPDKHGGDDSEMKAVNNANSALEKAAAAAVR